MITSEFDKKSINSPFRWAGGKFYARPIITPFIPNHKFYIEPFAGGASIFFHKIKTDSWLNDLDENLMNCYSVIKDDVENLINFLDGEQATKERHNYYKNLFKPSSKLEAAAQYYYLNRTSYSGIMKRQNNYFGYGDKYSMRPENWGRQLRKNSHKLQNVMLTSMSYEKLFSRKFKNDTFMFIDPPYFNADQDKFYRETFTYEDHVKLSHILQTQEKNFKFLLTYDNSDEIKEIYSWAQNMSDKEWRYCISRSDDQKKGLKLKDGHKGKRSLGKEIFIYNFEFEGQSQQELSI